MTTRKKKSVYRSAETGEFVSREEAKEHPATTYRDTVPIRNDDKPLKAEVQVESIAPADVGEVTE
jgi:hypothetical protein